MTSARRSRPAVELCKIALSAAPTVLVLTTISRRFQPTEYLGLSAPILVACLVIVVLAFATGLRLFGALLLLDRSTQLASLAWVVTVAYSAFVTAAQPQVAQILLLVALVQATFAFALDNRLSADWEGAGEGFLVAAGWGATAFGIVFYVVMLQFRDDPLFDFAHPGAGITNVRALGFYGLTAFCVGTGLIARSERRGRAEDLRNILFTTIGSGICLWSGGRAPAGAMALILILAIVSAPTDQRGAIATRLGMASIAGLGLSLVWVPSPAYGVFRFWEVYAHGQLIDPATGHRLAMWAESMQLFLRRPFLGYGLGQTRFLVASAQGMYPQPHNSIVQFLFQWGLVGTGAVLVMARSAIVRVRAAFLPTSDRSGFVALCLLAGHGAMSMLDGNLFHVYPVTIIVLALVCLANSGSEDERCAAR